MIFPKWQLFTIHVWFINWTCGTGCQRFQLAMLIVDHAILDEFWGRPAAAASVGQVTWKGSAHQLPQALRWPNPHVNCGHVHAIPINDISDGTGMKQQWFLKEFMSPKNPSLGTEIFWDVLSGLKRWTNFKQLVSKSCGFKRIIIWQNSFNDLFWGPW